MGKIVVRLPRDRLMWIDRRKMRRWFERWGPVLGIFLAMLLNDRVLHYSGWKAFSVLFVVTSAFFLPFVKFQRPKKREIPSADYLVLLNGERLPLDLPIPKSDSGTNQSTPIR